jgi:hypothetical protein
MQIWARIGAGLLICALARGCSNAEKPPTSLGGKQPLQTESSSGVDKPVAPMPFLPQPFANLPVSKLPSRNIQGTLLIPGLANSTKTQPKPPQVTAIPGITEASVNPKSQREQDNISEIDSAQLASADTESQADSINPDPDPPPGISASDDSEALPQLEPEARETLKDSPENLDGLRPVSNSYPSDHQRNVTPDGQSPSPSVVTANSQGSSGRCDYPWDFDSAGNRCGDRAASERPNSTIKSTTPVYAPPIRTYSPPTHTYSPPTSSFGSTYVRSYTRKNGTVVRGHFRRRR